MGMVGTISSLVLRGLLVIKVSECYIVFGRNTTFPPVFNVTHLMDGQQGFRLLGEEQDGQDLMGWSVSRVGDLNGDGLNDMMMGARSALSGDIRSGKSYVVMGSSHGFNATLRLNRLNGVNGFQLSGPAQPSRFGQGSIQWL